MNQKQTELVALATSQVGIHEQGGQNSGPVVEMYQRVIGKAEKEPWCVSFVQWCVREIDQRHGSKTLLFPTESSQLLWIKTPTVARMAKPEPGAIVIWTMFNNDLPLSIGHVGIVKEVLDENFMLTIEGNTASSTQLEREGDGVYLKRRHVSAFSGAMRVTGFLKPWIS